jgi:hypothetical protein
MENVECPQERIVPLISEAPERVVKIHTASEQLPFHSGAHIEHGTPSTGLA